MQDQSIFFPVEERDVFAAGVIHAPTHKAIVRTDTKEVLGIHSQRYNLVRNADIFPQLEEALGQTFDTNGMLVSGHSDKNGARTLRTYMFPEHQVEIANGDKVSFELRAANSYDGSQTFGLMAGGFRYACFNGMVIGSAMANIKKKHTRHLDIEEVLRSLDTAMGKYQENTELWQKWARTTITHEQARAILKELSSGERMYKDLDASWLVEAQCTGRTAWSLYQVLTAWSTHTKARTNHGTALLQREERVRHVLPELTALAA